jgi:hypothetical protein
MHLIARTKRHILAYALGALEALLLARLILRLLAARPDNPVVAALYAVTSPPAPLAALDAGQPRFGATLEFSTLALFLLVLLVGLLAARSLRREP